MRRHSLFCLLVFIVLFMPLALVDTPTVRADEPYTPLLEEGDITPDKEGENGQLVIGQTYPVQYGELKFLGYQPDSSRRWRFTSRIGEENIWNGEEYVRYIYEPAEKRVRIGKLQFTHGPNGVISIVHGDRGALVGDLKWYAQYYLSSQWNNFTFDNYEYLGAESDDYSSTVNQRWWSTNGELNVSYTYTNMNELKMRALATNWAAQTVPVRVFWVLSNIKDTLSYSLIYEDSTAIGASVGNGQQVFWHDVIENTPDININPIMDKDNHRAAIIFGNMSSTLSQYETMDIDPTYNIDSDNEDAYADTDGWTLYDGIWMNVVLSSAGSQDYEAYMRWQLPISYGSTIDSANVSFWELGDPDTYTIRIYRQSGSNAATAPEDLTAEPPIDTTYYTEFTTDAGNTGMWMNYSITNIVQDQVDASGWTTGNYMLLSFESQTNTLSGAYQIEDYQHIGTHPAYIEIDFTSPTYGNDWLAGWTYRQQHRVLQAAGAGENYTVRFVVNGESGENSGEDIYLSGKMKSDFSDVRFTDANGADLLPHWLDPKSIETYQGYQDWFVDDGASYALGRTLYANAYPHPYADWGNNRTYIAFAGPEDHPYVTYYDHETDTWAPNYRAGTNPLPATDGHGAPVIWVNDTGHVHILFGAHGNLGDGNIQHRETINPHDITLWQDATDIPLDVWGQSYPHPYYDPNTDNVYVLYRQDVTAGDQHDWGYRNSTDGGNSWSSVQKIVDCPSGYTVYPSNSYFDPNNNTIIHLSWRIHDWGPSLRDKMYYAYMNVTTGEIFNVTGHSMGTTIIQAEWPDVQVVDWDTDIYNGYVHVDDSSNPYIIFGNRSTSTSIAGDAYFIYWNSSLSSWSDAEFLCVNGVQDWNNGWKGGLDFILHNETSITAFLSEGANMTRYTWDGDTWTRAEWIRNATDDTRPLGISVVPQYWNGSIYEELQVIFCENTANMTTNPNDLQAYAWGTGGYLQKEYSGKALFWVRIAGNLTEADQIIYIYYGNDLASDTSDGESTFPFFDDFDRGDSSTVGNGWTEDESGGGTVEVSNNMLEIYSRQNDYNHIQQAPPTGMDDAAYYGRWNLTGDTGDSLAPWLIMYFNQYDYFAGGSYEPESYDPDRHYIIRNIDETYGATGFEYGDHQSEWIYWKLYANSSWVWGFISFDGYDWFLVDNRTRAATWSGVPQLLIFGKGIERNSGSYPNADFDNGVGTGDWGYSYGDDVFIRNFTYPEPQHGIYGGEELGSYDYVDELTTRDAQADVGTHSSFAAQQNAPDDVYDTLTEADLGGVGDDFNHWFTSYGTDIDSYPDVGTETNPANAQDYGDSDYMNIQEADQGAPMSEYVVPDGLSGAAIWTTAGVSPYLGAQDQPTNYIYTSDNNLVSQWYTFGATSGSGSGFTVNCSVYWNAAADSYISNIEIDWTGDGTADWSTSATSQTWAWDELGTVTGLDTATEINAARIRFTYNKGSGGPDTLSIDAARLGVSQGAQAAYELDFEYQWTNANYSETYEQVCINVQTYQQTGSETLKAWEWTGSAWASLGTFSQNGWNNFSASYLTSGTYYIKVNDTDQSADGDQDSWNIDSIILHTWSTDTNYRLDLEEGWTDANYDQDLEFLCIKWGSIGSEALNITVWNSTAASWYFLFQVTSSNASSWTNVSVSTWLTSVNLTIRFVDTVTASDTTQNTWQKDSCLLWTYPSPNSAPVNDQAPTVTNPTDTDNLYAFYQVYIITANCSDSNGHADIAYLDLTLASNDRATTYAVLRFNHSDNTFTEQSDPDNNVVLNTTGSNYYTSGNDLDMEFWIEVNWTFPDNADMDWRAQVYDNSEASDDDWYEVAYDVETRLELSSGPILSDGIGTANRGEFDDTITASGTVNYYGGTVHPYANQIDVWVGASEYGSNVGPWNMTNYADAGTFSGSVYADDEVGLDTHTFKAVLQGEGWSGTDNFQATESASYITDRLNITIEADENNPSNDQQVNFTLTVEYDYDDTTCTTYEIQIARNGSAWYTFTNANKTLFNDTNSDAIYLYNATSDGDGVSEGTHGLSTSNPFLTNTLTITWGGAAELTLLINELLDMFDSTTPAQTLVLTVNEVIDISDSVSVAMTAVITILEILGLAAVVATEQTSTVSISELIAFESATSTTINLSTTIDELIDLSDSLSSVLSGVVNINETIDLFDSVTATAVSVVSIGEVIGLSDTASTVLNAGVAINEVIDLYDSLSTVLSGAVTINEVIDLFDSVATALGGEYFLTVNELIDLSDTVSTAISVFVTVNETLPLYDTVLPAMGGYVTVLETLPLADSISTVLSGAVSINELIDLSDTASTVLSGAVTINELIDLFDSVATALGGEFFLTVNELIDLSETIVTTISVFTTINETIPFYDSILPAVSSYVTILETLPLSETISTVLNAGVIVLESIPITYTTTTAVSLSLFINEIIELFDSTTTEIPIFSVVINEIIPITSHITVSGTPTVEEEGGLFYELFLSREPWGYFGPIAVVIGGYIVTNKDRFLGVLWFIMECLFIGHYLSLVDASPFYWWHIYILLLGGLFTIIYPLFEGGRRR